ncbi:MAG: crossover junction endodeoxyribonuclease RuvC [Deltaproteobacteria bacterium]|nr:crossover junction endodeoxyribonuclease RuvC [Deltaproteobacteria bacterium]
MRVLGIDPGTQRTGWGIVETRRRRLVPLASGVIRTGKRPLPARLKIIHDSLTEVIREWAPGVVAIEDIFMAKHANAAMKLGHARGAAMVAAANCELDVHEYPPALVKRTVAGKGGADKTQVAKMVAVVLGLKELPGLDATDALAIAITHCQGIGRPASGTRPKPGAATTRARKKRAL